MSVVFPLKRLAKVRCVPGNVVAVLYPASSTRLMMLPLAVHRAVPPEIVVPS